MTESIFSVRSSVSSSDEKRKIASQNLPNTDIKQKMNPKVLAQNFKVKSID